MKKIIIVALVVFAGCTPDRGHHYKPKPEQAQISLVRNGVVVCEKQDTWPLDPEQWGVCCGGTIGRLETCRPGSDKKRIHSYTPDYDDHCRLQIELAVCDDSPEKRKRDGWTDLMEWAWAGHLRNVRILIEEGVEIDAQDKQGNTALMWAAIEGHSEVVGELIRAGADPCKQNKGHGMPLDMIKDKCAINACACKCCEHISESKTCIMPSDIVWP